MPARERIGWAKEMMLEWIDEGMSDFIISRPAALDWDEKEELRKQRKRIAAFLGLG